jgi:arginine metabolism regulation protein II
MPLDDEDDASDSQIFGNGVAGGGQGVVQGAVDNSNETTRREYEALQELLSTLVGTDLVTMMPQDTSPSSLFATIHCDPVQYLLNLDGKFGLPSQSLVFTAQSRYLLDHYINRVIPIMTVVTHPKNPWRTIYLPRALSAVGDLISLGRTSSARNALLHALLASSAFNLKSRFPDGSDAQKHYFQLGVRLKSEAYIWLGDCLGRDLSKQKYKDVVTAVLSMVTIDVLWGSMSDCQLHLAAVESIIDLRYKTRPKMSRKAKILHRIAGMYALLQRSTVMDSAVDEVDNERWLDINIEDLEPNTGVSTPADTSINSKAVAGCVFERNANNLLSKFPY